MRNRLVFYALLPLVAACDSPVETASDVSSRHVTASVLGAPAITAGGGQLTVGGTLTVQFSYNAVQLGEGAVGHAHHSVVVGGQPVEFSTTVTCMSVDAANGRAWIGGTIRVNNSTNPGWTGAVHEPGDDIWFRVADYGEGGNASQADRSTFVGFEGSAGIITSQEYCDTQPWPAGDAGTNPVTAGNLQVRG
jgi:hypothetical protein